MNRAIARAEEWRLLDGEWHTSFSGRAVYHLDSGRGESVCAGKYYLNRDHCRSRNALTAGNVCRRCLKIAKANRVIDAAYSK